MPKNCFPIYFPILGGHNLTRALQSSSFQISGGVVQTWWRTDGRTKEILVSNIGWIWFTNFTLCNNRGNRLPVTLMPCPSLKPSATTVKRNYQESPDWPNTYFWSFKPAIPPNNCTARQIPSQDVGKGGSAVPPTP